MTVSYSETISSSQGGVFIKILLLWKGSLYKLLYTDLIVYLIMYYAFNIIYRACMGPEARQSFELVVKFCEEMDKSIPLSFILGFFVAGVIGRWWQMYLNIPWLNRISFFAYGILTGTKDSFETARRLRLSIMRYMNLGWILLMHSISEQIMHRFSGQEEEEPQSKSNLVQEERGVRGLLENINKCPEVKLHFRKLVTEAEIEAFVRAEGEYKNKYQKKYVPEYWLPLQWAALLCKKAMMHGFCDPRSMVMMMEEIEEVRGTMQTLVIYNDVMIPLVYTQVVIIAVYSFFLLQLFSQQFVNPKLTADLLSAERNVTVTPISIGNKDNHGEVIDMYFPVFTVFQFMFLMGWLKVAMCVMNPFGDDDEDFHTSEILNYNLEISSRCAEGQAITFPEGLSEPSMEWIKKSPGFEADNLFEYLEAAEMEFSAVEPPDPTERLKPFTVEKTRWQALRDFLLCRGGDATSGGGGAEAGNARQRRREHNGGGGGDPQQSGASIPLTAKA